MEKRAAYYEEAGVLRDMFQNHMMQLLAVTAMEPPAFFEAERVRDEHVKVFRSLRPIARDDPSKNLVLGQYGAGVVDGKRVPGYREEPGVKPDSLTPTFGMMKLFIDNWRWQDVPFHLASGKRLAGKLTEIVIYFKNVPHLLFEKVLDENITANLLTLRIQPEEKINLTFETKYPGAKVCFAQSPWILIINRTMKDRFWTHMKKRLLTACKAIRCSSGGRTASNCAGLSWIRSCSTAKIVTTCPDS